jgi:hypothetical protein
MEILKIDHCAAKAVNPGLGWSFLGVCAIYLRHALLFCSTNIQQKDFGKESPIKYIQTKYFHYAEYIFEKFVS